MKNIGYIGLGIMGAPAARNLLKNGFAVHVWARRGKEATAELVAAGAVHHDDPHSLAAAVDAVVTNVSDGDDVEAVTLGDGGVAGNMTAGGLIIDMSTIAPSVAVRLAQRLAERKIDFLDAPVSGGEKGAIDGTLTFMVGGDEAAFQRAQPIFSAMGRTITHIGPSGSGQVAKTCNQIIIGATVSGVAEAFNLAKRSGTDLGKIRAALQGGFAASKVMDIHAQRMIDDDYAPGFKTTLHHKDINIALAEAEAAGVPLPSAEIFRQRLRRLMEQGDGDLDSSAVMKTLEE